ncbi:P-loop NTPase fold protein [Pyxidicoccus sp. 3LFB2]
MAGSSLSSELVVPKKGSSMLQIEKINFPVSIELPSDWKDQVAGLVSLHGLEATALNRLPNGALVSLAATSRIGSNEEMFTKAVEDARKELSQFFSPDVHPAEAWKTSQSADSEQVPSLERRQLNPIESFILHNSKDAVSVEPIVKSLEAHGVSIHFDKQRLTPGQSLKIGEQRALQSASCVLAFLGESGWDPNQLFLLGQAQALGKRLIPVLIGLATDEESISAAGGLFRSSQYLDLRALSEEKIEILVSAIRSRPSPATRDSQVERIIRILVDGNEAQREDTLRQVRLSRSIDRRALAARLREQIRERFSPAHEDRTIAADRTPKRIASIRAWMLSCLNRTDPEAPHSRDLLLRHVQAKFEPDQNVRFWTLAGLYSVNVSFLQEAVAQVIRSEPSPEVVLLANAITARNRAEFVANMRSMVSASSFEFAWPALRVLRVVPMTELAGDVAARLSDEAFTYDALYALANASMASAAAPMITARFGIEAIVALILNVAQDSADNAIRAFALVLDSLERKTTLRALEHAMLDPARRDAASAILTELQRGHEQDLDGMANLFVPGFASEDLDITRDRLDVGADVKPLVAVMLAKEVKPPLAIGLFGDWGTGKSFFMKAMQEAGNQLQRGPSASKFCTNIVSIEFNAWHYVDTNLWASLVSHILDRLDAHVSPRPTAEEEHSNVVTELGAAREVVDEVYADKKRAEDQISEREKQLVELKRARETKELKLSELRASDLQALLSEDDRKLVEQSLEGMGVPSTLNSIADVQRIASDAYSIGGHARALFVSLFRQSTPMFWFLLIIALAGVPACAYLMANSAILSESVASTTAILAQIAAVAGGVTAVGKRVVMQARSTLMALDEARQRISLIVANKRKNPTPDEVALQAEIDGLKSREQDVASRLATVRARVAELEERLTALAKVRSLARFLAERSQSEDYRKHLGLIATIRQDLDALSARLTAGAQGDGGTAVDRIVLYIDDLDRCPPPKVMEILQAVHLLLAYRLFVVVVGVDPRWLLHSLETTYSAFQKEGADAQEARLWETTPQNYLEKIFQIPFSVRPMSSKGYGRLVRDLLRPEDAQNSLPETPPLSVLNDSLPVSKTEKSAAESVASNSVPPSFPSVNPKQPVEIGGPSRSHSTTIHEDALVIQQWEATFAERLFRLMPTPRATKRFSNIYRILKAPLPKERLSGFEGTAAVLGEFQIPMLLLALLIGAPSSAGWLFPELLRRALAGHDPTQILGNLREFAATHADVERLQAKVQLVLQEPSFPRGPDPYIEWLPQVARFSFEVARSMQAGFLEDAVH